MKNKFTKIVFSIFSVCMIIYLFAVGYFKNNNSNMNNSLVYIVIMIFCVACITGVMLIIIGIRNMIKFLKKSGNISMKKIICLLVILGLGSYYGGEILAQHKVSSQDNSVTSQVNTANNQQNDDSEDQTNNTSDTSTHISTSNVDSQNSNTDTSTNTNIDTPNRSSSGKLTSSDGYLELESKKGNYDNITGTIKNLSSEPYSYVEVNINLYDDNGNQVESTLTNMNNLEGNGTWNFTAPVLYPDKSRKYKVVSIEGNR